MDELLKEWFHVIETVVAIYRISDVFVMPLLDNFLLCMCVYFSVCRYPCVCRCLPVCNHAYEVQDRISVVTPQASCSQLTKFFFSHNIIHICNSF